MRALSPLLLALFLAAPALAADPLPGDRPSTDRDASTNFNRLGVKSLNADRMTLRGSGSTGDVSAMSVTPSASAADGTLAKRLHTPTFGGPVTAPSLTLSGVGSTGDVSGMAVTAGGATRNLAAWFPLLAPLASPSFSGTVSAPSLTLSGSGLTGPVDGGTVGGTVLPTVLNGKAPLASPTFSGVVTAPSLTLTGSGSTGDVTAMAVTAGGATRSLGAWLPLLAPLASPTFTGAVTAPSLALSGSGLTGPVDGGTVGGTALPTALAGKAPLASPSFSGTVTAPMLALTASGSTGDVSTMSATPSTSAASGTLARLIADRVTAASPTMSGTLTHTGAAFSLGAGALGNTSQPINAYLDMIAPNDRYHDNVLTIENRSVDAATGACGNAAIRFRDPTTGYERAAVGWSRLSSCAAGFFPNTIYMEGGNIGPPNDPYATDIAWIITHAQGAKYFPGAQYRILWAQASTNMIRMTNSKGVSSHEFDTEGYYTTFNGPVGGNGIQFAAVGAGAPPRLIAIGSDANVSLNLVTKGTGALLLNGVPLPQTTTTNNWLQQQTFGNGVNVTSGGVRSGQFNFGGGNQSIYDNGSNGVVLRTGAVGSEFYSVFDAAGNLSVQKRMSAESYTANGTAGVSCNGAPTANFQAVNGIVTRC